MAGAEDLELMAEHKGKTQLEAPPLGGGLFSLLSRRDRVEGLRAHTGANHCDA